MTERRMESYLEMWFGGLQAKNSCKEAPLLALFCSVVKNPKRRFRFIVDIEKRSEMEATKHAPRASSAAAA